MSNAYKCDGCGELREGESPNKITVQNTTGATAIGGPYVREGEYDICGDCGKELDRFLVLNNDD